MKAHSFSALQLSLTQEKQLANLPESGVFLKQTEPDAGQKFLIIGGGFAGATLAREAERILPPSARITVISRDNHLLFSPMLPELAGRSVSFNSIAIPGRLMTKRTFWIEATVTKIDAASNTLEFRTEDGRVESETYSQLVIACGSDAALDGIPGLKAHGLALKTAGDALILSNEVIGRFEAAVAETDEAQPAALLHAVVIGGGFSGVELAGELGDLMDKLARFYPEIAPVKPRVTILHREKRVLPEFSHESLSDFTLRKLRDNGIEVRLETTAAEVTGKYVALDSGERIDTRLVISTIGTRTSPLIATLGVELEKGRLKTGGDMRVNGQQNIWAIGDCALLINAFDHKPSPPTAQFALRQAAQLAQNLARTVRGEATVPFRFRPQGMLASIGRKNGVAEIFGFQFSGHFAWMLWRAIYLGKIPGLSRKVGVFFEWLSSALFPPPLAKIRVPNELNPRHGHYAKGDVLFETGWPLTTTQFIENGHASLSVQNSADSSIPLERGDYFSSLIFGGDAGGGLKIRLTADGPLDVIEVDDGQFHQFSESFAPLREQLAGALKMRTILGRLLTERARDPKFAATRIRDVMQPLQNRLQPEMTIGEAQAHFEPSQPGYWIVDSEERITGYFGRLELYAGLSGHTSEDPVSSVLRQSPPPLLEDQDLLTATAALFRHGMDHLPVVDASGRVTGVYDPLSLIRSKRL